MISIFQANEKLFDSNGDKILHPTKATIRKEDNGEYYILLKDVIQNLQYYQEGLIVVSDTPWGRQGFRLTNPEINDDKISCKGYHLYFDTKRYLIVDSYVVDKNCNDALDHLNNACDVVTPFTTISDINVVNSYRCVRHTLEEAISVIIDRWGGHLVRDNFHIEIREKIGQDRGIVLSPSKNIKNIKTVENWDDVVTKILPVGKDGTLLPNKFVELEEYLYPIPYTKKIEFDQSSIIEDDFTEDGVLDEQAYKNALIEDLYFQANEYLKSHKLPKVNYTLNAKINGVSDIGDIIYVKHPKCNVDITTNVIAIEYDPLNEVYSKIEFGNFKNKLNNLIDNVTTSINEDVSKSIDETSSKLEKELLEATNKINDAMTTSYVINDGGSQILIVDKLPKEEAVNVIRLNSAGIGFSRNGIYGTFNSAWTIDSVLDMQQVNVINLVADMIKGGTLKLGSNLNEAGILELYDEANKLISKFDKTGLVFYCNDGTYIKINPEVGFAGYDANNNKTYWVDEDEFHQKKSVVEEEITIASKVRILPIQTDTNNGIGFVPVV